MTYFANRGDDLEMRELKTQYDLGRTRFVFYSPRDRASIQDVIADADVVVNLIGKYYESGQPVQTKSFPYVSYATNYSFEDANIVIPQTIAEICKEMQVDHLIHVSSASAKPDAKSRWSRTKYEGELAVKKAFPWATIVRPTQIFGKDDFFLSWFARTQEFLQCQPLIYNVGGREAVTQPVHVNDVAKTIQSICDAPAKFEGRTIDCFGPDDFTRSELAKFVNDITQQNKTVLNIPIEIYRLLAKAAQYTRDPLITPDLVEVWCEDFVPRMTAAEYRAQPDRADKILTMEDVGIQATPLDKVAFGFLHHYRRGGHFFRVSGYH
jgi:NADH dehydrogenase (ubiquinone) 1 alpha subcomplex subunit 9